MNTWRDVARPIISRVIQEVGTEDHKALRVALREAYPFGLRQYHPYKIWCHEIRVQLGEVRMKSRDVEKRRSPCDGQLSLF